jgi:hypothetical protein
MRPSYAKYQYSVVAAMRTVEVCMLWKCVCIHAAPRAAVLNVGGCVLLPSVLRGDHLSLAVGIPALYHMT